MTPLNFFVDENNLLLINWDVNSGRFRGGGGGGGFDWGRPPPDRWIKGLKLLLFFN